MQEVVVALFALGIGVLFCFYGYKAMRFLFPLWGLVAGYWIGAEVVHAITGDGFFSTALAIGVGIGCGLVGMVLSYLFYAVAVVLFMGVLGYWIGAGLLIAAGVDPGFLTALVGLALGLVIALAALFGNAPKYFLLFFTAFGGGALIVTGLLLLGNVVNLPDLKDGIIATVTKQAWLWQVMWIGLGVFGLWTQMVSSREEELVWLNEWKES